jgi:hypothetical protein
MATPALIIIPKALFEMKGWRESQNAGEGSAAVIRWQADADGSWEVETVHRGFRHLETAAVFAAGSGADSPVGLHLSPNGDPLIVFPNGLASSSRVASIRFFELTEDVHGCERMDFDVSRLASLLGEKRSFTRVHGYVVGPEGAVFDVSIRDRAPGSAPSVELWPCRASVA